MGKDPTAMVERFAKSKGAFDKWFIEQIAVVHGINPDKMPPANESYLDLL